MSGFTNADFEAQIARDKNLQALQIAIAAQTELRESVAIKAIQKAFEADAKAALWEFAYADPTSLKEMTNLQVRVRAFVFMSQTLDNIEQVGRVAEDMIREESNGLEG
jgi:hypothetical protein